MNPNGYVTCNIKGGLGNQLFQVFATLSYSRRTGRTAVFIERSEIGDRPAYFDTFFSFLKPNCIAHNDYHYLFYNSGLGTTYEEPCFEYREIPLFPSHINVVLNGYFQSEKYFEKDWKEVFDILWEFKRKKIVKTMIPFTKKTIGCHFRLGDYVNKQQYHPLMPTDYYLKAISQALSDLSDIDGNEIEVLYFCDEKDVESVKKIIQKLSAKFPSLGFRRAEVHTLEFVETEKDKDWREMILFGLCDAHIIANSTFSWWGAYLNRYFNRLEEITGENLLVKKCYYPSVWFGPALHYHNTKDLCPSEWTKITIE